jgi:hypothetical protein
MEEASQLRIFLRVFMWRNYFDVQVVEQYDLAFKSVWSWGYSKIVIAFRKKRNF